MEPLCRHSTYFSFVVASNLKTIIYILSFHASLDFAHFTFFFKRARRATFNPSAGHFWPVLGTPGLLFAFVQLGVYFTGKIVISAKKYIP